MGSDRDAVRVAPREPTARRPADQVLFRPIGPYVPVALLGQGGMGSVYAAEELQPNGARRLVAIKIAHPDTDDGEDPAEVLRGEAAITQRVRHPHVVSVLGLHAIEGGPPALVMEHVEGPTLHVLLRESRGPIPASIAVRIVFDALEGLAAAHAATDDQGVPLRVVHRDVSPANLLVRTDGLTLLADFGVARADDRDGLTRPGFLKGKIGYLSPEQIHGTPIDARTDVFAMGVVLWESLTGRRLFDGGIAQLVRTPDRAARPLADERPELAALDAVLLTALARDVDARFQSAEAFGDALLRVASRTTGIATRAEVADYVARIAARPIALQRAAIARGRTQLVGRIELDATWPAQPRFLPLTLTARRADEPTAAESPAARRAPRLAVPTPVSGVRYVPVLPPLVRDSEPPEDLEPTRVEPPSTALHREVRERASELLVAVAAWLVWTLKRLRESATQLLRRR